MLPQMDDTGYDIAAGGSLDQVLGKKMKNRYVERLRGLDPELIAVVLTIVGGAILGILLGVVITS